MAAEVKRQGSWRDLREYLDALEAARLLVRVAGEVDLRHEIGAICEKSINLNGPGLLFENIKGYPELPLVANILSTPQQLGLALGTPADQDRIFEKLMHGAERSAERPREPTAEARSGGGPSTPADRLLPSTVLPSGPCKEVVDRREQADVYKFPTPWWHELDGGQYIGTTSGCVTQDPETGVINMGNYRVMIKDQRTLTMNAAGPHPIGQTLQRSNAPAMSSRGGAARHVLYNEARGLPTPFALALSMDPFLTLAAGTPVPPDAAGSAEYEAAGGWRGAPTELVKCETSDLLVPAHAEIIIEGEVQNGVRAEEGPHGESQGFYGHNPLAFVINITCITHRRNPISYGLICRVVEDYPRALIRSGLFEAEFIRKTGLSSVKRAFLADVGRMGMLIVAADIPDPAEPQRIMDAAWELTNARWVVVVDEDCDVRNWSDVMWRVAWGVTPKEHVVLGPERGRSFRAGGDGDGEVPPPNAGMGIDATLRFKDFNYPPKNQASPELRARVDARWRELGLP